MGKYSQNENGKTKFSPVYSYLSAAHIRTMAQSGRVEIGNHTFDMHHPTSPRRGVKRRQGESAAEYERALLADSEKCRTYLRQCGCDVNVFTFPFGYYGDDSVRILQKAGYRAMLTCNEGVTTFKKGSTRGLYGIKRYNRPGDESAAAFFKKVGL